MAIVLAFGLIGVLAGAGTAIVLADDDAAEVSAVETTDEATTTTNAAVTPEAEADDPPSEEPAEPPAQAVDPPVEPAESDPPPGPDPVSAADALMLHRDSVIALEAVGCRHGSFSSGVITAPATITAPFAIRYRTGHVQLVGESGISSAATVVGATPDATILVAPAEAGAAAVFDVDSPSSGPAFVIYRGRSTFASEVLEAEISSVSGAEIRLSDPGLPSDALGGLIVAETGEAIGIVTGVNSGVVEGLLPALAGPSAEIDPADLACPAVESGSPASNWRSFAHPSVASALLAQHLADSLAFDDWPTVRQLEPGKAEYDDARFEEGWGTLLTSTLVPVWSNETLPNVYEWRMGLIAHELVEGETVTKVFCVTWGTNLVAGEVAQLPRSGRVESLGASGLTDPNSITQSVKDECWSIEGD